MAEQDTTALTEDSTEPVTETKKMWADYPEPEGEEISRGYELAVNLLPQHNNNSQHPATEISSSTLKLLGLDPSIRAEQIKNLFQEAGEVLSVDILRNNAEPNKSVAFITFLHQIAAERAWVSMYNRKLGNERIKRMKFVQEEVRAIAKLFVGDIPRFWNEKDLESIFIKFGQIAQVTVIRNKPEDRTNRGFGFVTFLHKSSAYKARKAMDGSTILGKEIRVKYAKEKEGNLRPRNKSKQFFREPRNLIS